MCKKCVVKSGTVLQQSCLKRFHSAAICFVLYRGFWTDLGSPDLALFQGCWSWNFDQIVQRWATWEILLLGNFDLDVLYSWVFSMWRETLAVDMGKTWIQWAWLKQRTMDPNLQLHINQHWPKHTQRCFSRGSMSLITGHPGFLHLGQIC